MKEQKTCILSYQAGAKEPDHRGNSQMYWRTRGCRWVGWRWLLKGAVESRREKSTLWIHIYFDYSFIGFAFNTVEHNIHMWFGTVQAFMALRKYFLLACFTSSVLASLHWVPSFYYSLFFSLQIVSELLHLHSQPLRTADVLRTQLRGDRDKHLQRAFLSHFLKLFSVANIFLFFKDPCCPQPYTRQRTFDL